MNRREEGMWIEEKKACEDKRRRHVDRREDMMRGG